MSSQQHPPEDGPAEAHPDEASPGLEVADIDFDAVLGEALAAVERHERRPDDHGDLPRGAAAEATGLHQALDEARREVARLRGELARSQQDVASLRRLTQRQEAELPTQAVKRVLVDLLPALDHLDTLSQHLLNRAELAAADRQAVEMLDAEWRRAQQRLQLEAYDAVGEEFDAQRHEVIATLADPAQPAGTVLRQAGRGYLWNGKLLRLAQVVLNAGRAGPPRQA